MSEVMAYLVDRQALPIGSVIIDVKSGIAYKTSEVMGFGESCVV
jgi:hypothetical protein